MNKKEYVLEIIDYLYADGDVDDIFYWQLLSEVTYYTTPDDEDVRLEKSDEQRKLDSLLLANYLISTTDFVAGSTTQPSEGVFNYELMPGGFDEFSQHVNKKVASIGLDGDWHYEIWLKKVNVGCPAPRDVPCEIVELFLEQSRA